MTAIVHLDVDVRSHYAEAFDKRGQPCVPFPTIDDLRVATAQLQPVLVYVETQQLVSAFGNLTQDLSSILRRPVRVIALTDAPNAQETDAILRHGARPMIRPPDKNRVVDNAAVLHARSEVPFAEPRVSEPPQPKAGGKQILVVDDSPTMRNLLAKLLTLRGHRVLYADSAALALRILDNNVRVDLVVSDLIMPGMDGFELKYEIDRQRLFPMPFVLCTTENNEENKRIALKLGKSEFVPKPVNPEELFAAIDRLVGS